VLLVNVLRRAFGPLGFERWAQTLFAFTILKVCGTTGPRRLELLDFLGCSSPWGASEYPQVSYDGLVSLAFPALHRATYCGATLSGFVSVVSSLHMACAKGNLRIPFW